MGGAASAAASAAPKAQLRVVGLGDPVTDVVVNVDAAALQYLGLEPGSCTSVRSQPYARGCRNAGMAMRSPNKRQTTRTRGRDNHPNQPRLV